MTPFDAYQGPHHRSEIFNALSHLVGAVFALIGAIILIIMTAKGGDPWKITSAAIYGTTLFLLYLFSTLYHGLRGTAKRIMREFDHHGIYLLIAGSYTPICLVTLRGTWGWALLGVMWGLAFVGCLQELRARHGSRKWSLVIYLVMGWVAVVPALPLLRTLGVAGFTWLAVGGLSYTTGIVFYVMGKRVPYAHGIWHLFVIAGSTAHYFAMLLYVL